MGSLIDFLLSNLFFLILVIGGIYSFFKRTMDGQKQQEQRRRTQQQQPMQRTTTVPEEKTFDPFEQFEKMLRKETGNEPIQRDKEQKFDNVDEDRKVIESRNEGQPSGGTRSEGHQQSEDISDREIGSKDISISEDGRRNLDREHTELVKPINRKQVVQGVIWAEVLGRPRSTQPHQTARLYRKIGRR
jgi:hypothetical protein